MIDSVLQKMNVKSGLILMALLLFFLGSYLCIGEVKAVGVIDIQSTLFKGRITSGSLGLLILTLSVPIAYFASRLSSKNKHIEVSHSDMKIRASNMDESEWLHIIACVRQHEADHSSLVPLSQVTEVNSAAQPISQAGHERQAA